MNKVDNKEKSYAIIGFGNMGKVLAKAFARNHIQVAVATTREPESFAAEAAAIGSDIIPVKLADAVRADIIFLAVRFQSHPDIAKELPTWKHKTIIDVTNAYGVPLEKLEGQPSAKIIENAFTDAKLVKGFNHLAAAVFDQDLPVRGARRVVFLSGDDDSAVAEIDALAENLGFAPIKLGRLAEGGMLIHGYESTWGQLIFKDLVKFDR